MATLSATSRLFQFFSPLSTIASHIQQFTMFFWKLTPAPTAPKDPYTVPPLPKSRQAKIGQKFIFIQKPQLSGQAGPEQHYTKCS